MCNPEYCFSFLDKLKRGTYSFIREGLHGTQFRYLTGRAAVTPHVGRAGPGDGVAGSLAGR